MSSPARNFNDHVEPQSSLDRVLRALDEQGRQPKLRGHHVQARCPLHNNHSRSLSVDWKADRDGFTQLNCHSCHATERDILEALGLTLSDRFDTPPRRPDTPAPFPVHRVQPPANRLGPLPNRVTEVAAPADPRPPRWNQVRVYDYVDEAGELLGQVVRLERVRDGVKEKWFRQRHPDGRGGWIGEAAARHVLRHLPEVIAANAAGLPVWLAEGEKDDEALRAVLRPAGSEPLGAATTNNNGAGGFHGDQVEQLRGARVVLAVDRDRAGWHRAVDLSNRLEGVAASVRIVLSAVTAAKADAADHLAAGHGLDEFVPLSLEHAKTLAAAADTGWVADQADKRARQAEIAWDETRARLEQGAAAVKRGAVKAAEQERRFAFRWAQQAVQDVRAVAGFVEQCTRGEVDIRARLAEHGQPSAELPGFENNIARAEEALQRSQRLAQQAWDACGQPMPSAVRDVLLRAAPNATTAEQPAPDDDGVEPGVDDGNVVQFPGGGGPHAGSPIRWTEYLRLPSGALVERRFDRDGNEFLVGVLNLDARILCAEYVENESDDDDSGSPAAAAALDETLVMSYVIGYSHPATGELMSLRVPAERARTGDWLADLPATGLKYDSSTRGRSKVWDAIRATSTDMDTATVYRSSGWRYLPGSGWGYIHSGGAITAAGNLPLPVRLPGSLSYIDLPNPVRDPGEIRAAFDNHSRALMTKLLPHVGAVLAGTAYRAVLGWTGPMTALYGVPGTFKSGVATLTMHHFGVRWEPETPAASMSGNGATLNALREMMWHAKDALFFLDDAAPDKGVEAASALLAQIGRMQFNREKRPRLDPRRDERPGASPVKEGKCTRTTAIGTTEVRASDTSGQERLNVVDLAKGDLDLSNIIELDTAESRRGRATLMASLLSWMAGQPIPEMRAWARTRVLELAEQRRDAGADPRVARPLAELKVGWELMARFLVAVGAYTADQAAELLTEVEVALTDAGNRAVDPDSPNSLGERCRQIMVSVLRSGAIHLTYPGGLTPHGPEALRYGHRRVSLGFDRTGEELYRTDARGEWAGVVSRTRHGLRLHVDPTVMTAAIMTAARRTDEPLRAGRTVIQRELATIGLLRTEAQGVHTRFTCVVPDPSGDGSQTRLWDLDADRLFDPDGADPDTPQPTPDPASPPGPDVPSSVPPGDDQDTESVRDVSSEEDQMRVNPATGQYDTEVLSERKPCVGCGKLTEFVFDGLVLHPSCEPPAPELDAPGALTEAAASTPTRPAAPVEQRPVVIAPVRAASTAATPARPPEATNSPRGRTRGPTVNPWKYSVVIVDPDGLYLPDGTVATPVPVRSIADLGAIADNLGIGHPAGAGLMVLTQALVEQLGMVPDQDALVAPKPDGEPATEDTIAERIQQFLAGQTGFLSNPDGWESDRGVGPWMRIHRHNRGLRVMLEPYEWIWNRRGADSHGPFVDLPDVEQDPAACWTELARRLGRLAELLGIPWSTSPATTGEAIADQIQRGRSRANGRVLTEAGPTPELSTTGQARLEDEYVYRRRPAPAELKPAGYLHKYDRRGSYLANAGGTDLGFGTPEHVGGVAAADLISTARVAASKTKVPFGLWRVSLPAWEQTGPAPHPHQVAHTTIDRWITTATLTLLLDDDAAGGAGYTVAELTLVEAWIWPEQARFLEPWYTRIRDALLAARAVGDQAVADAIKGTYAGYVGRMASSWTARSARPWHHQPVWEATIRASARAALWRAVHRHHLATGRMPVGIDRDEVGYLDDDRNPRTRPPAADNGRLGALKHSGTVELTDELRRKLASGAISPMDKDLPILDDDDDAGSAAPSS